MVLYSSQKILQMHSTRKNEKVLKINGNIKARKTMRNKRMLRVRRKKYDRGERYVQKIIHRMAEASGFYGS